MLHSKKTKDGALFIGLYLGILLVSLFIPFIFVFSLLVLPVIFAIYTYRHDLQAAIIMSVVALLASFIIIPALSIPVTIFVALGGIMIGYAIQKGISPYETWARATVGFIGGFLFIFLFTHFALNINWAEQIDLIVEDSMRISQQFTEQIGLGDQTEEQVELLQKQLGMIKNLIPASISIAAIIIGFISQWLTYQTLNRQEKAGLGFPLFRELKLPTPLIWVYFFALIFMMFDANFDSTFYIGAYNVFLIAGFFVALQGFSFIFFYAHHKWKSNVLPIISIILTVIFPFLLLYIIRIIGIIDIGFGLKERMSSRK